MVALLGIIFSCLLMATGTTRLKFSVVPPSPNPSSKLNQKFQQELEKITKWTTVEDGRIWFQTEVPCPCYSELSSLKTSSIRLVALENHNLNLLLENGVTDVDGETDTSMIIQSLCQDWEPLTASVAEWEAAGNSMAGVDGDRKVTFIVSARKWSDSVVPNGSTVNMRRDLSLALNQQFGWTPVSKKADYPTFRFHLLLYKSSIVLELVTLASPLVVDNLPKPGFKRVESYIIAKAAQIQPKERVLDPMCGRATFLVEAATIWPDAIYEGIDSSR